MWCRFKRRCHPRLSSGAADTKGRGPRCQIKHQSALQRLDPLPSPRCARLAGDDRRGACRARLRLGLAHHAVADRLGFQQRAQRHQAFVDELLHPLAAEGFGGENIALGVGHDAVHRIELAGLRPLSGKSAAWNASVRWLGWEAKRRWAPGRWLDEKIFPALKGPDSIIEDLGKGEIRAIAIARFNFFWKKLPSTNSNAWP